jgi:hypothetical protein
VECPDGVDYLWGYFTEIDRRRTSNGFGMNPISYGELEAWTRLTGNTLSSFELEILDVFEEAALRHRNKIEDK